MPEGPIFITKVDLKMHDNRVIPYFAPTGKQL